MILRSKSLRLSAAVLAALTVVAAGRVVAQAPAVAPTSPAEQENGQAEAPVEAPQPPAVEVPAEMRTPRAVLTNFIDRMRADEKKAAARLMDLSNLNSATAETRGPDLAFKLYDSLRRLVKLPSNGDVDFAEVFAEADYAEVPDDPDHPDPWPLSEWDGVTEPEAESIVIARNPETLAWRFSRETVESIDRVYEVVETKEVIAQPSGEDEPTETFGILLRNAFPPSMRKTYFLLPTYQWLLLFCLAPLGRFADKLTRRVLTWIGDFWLKRYDREYFEEHGTSISIWRPIGRLVNACVWVFGAYVLELPVRVTNVLFFVLLVVTIVMALLAAFGIIDLLADYFVRRAKRSNRRSDDLLVPLIASTMKIITGLISALATVAVFSSELPGAMLGGLGIGGIAIALASQETLSNFFGSITLVFDRPFEVGDWVKIDDIEGEVESLGFRSTRLRTGINSQVTLPNSKLASASVDNWGRRKYRRYLNKLGLEYGTPPEKIEAFCEGVRELIRRHPHTRKDFYACYFNDFGASSLDVILVAFFEVPDWATELRERHRLLADVLRLAQEIGVSFAFPTQTLHLDRNVAPVQSELTDPDASLAGARAGAKIAGELPNYQDRPGKVKFTGPTAID